MTRALNILLLTAFVHPIAAQSELKPDATTRYDRAISAATPHGEVQLAAREIQVDVLVPGKKISRGGALLVVFDPSSGYFLGRFGWIPGYSNRLDLLAGFMLSSTIYLDSDRIVSFTEGDGAVYIRESSKRAASLDDAEHKALQDATGHLADYAAYATSGSVVSLGYYLGRRFFSGPTDVRRVPVKLTNIERHGDEWQITVVGRWKARITLNDKYEVINTGQIR